MEVQKNEDAANRARQKKYDLQERLIDFAVLVLEIVEALPKTSIGNHIGGQLMRCGTSPAANYGEARAAESKKDFVHKMKVCLKELRETLVWLTVIEKKGLLQGFGKLDFALEENNELISIFVTSIGTAEKNNEKWR